MRLFPKLVLVGLPILEGYDKHLVSSVLVAIGLHIAVCFFYDLVSHSTEILVCMLCVSKALTVLHLTLAVRCQAQRLPHHWV